MFQSPKKPEYQREATPEERAWWEQNKHRAVYVKDRGYYVEGTNGFFDENGRPLPSVSGVEGAIDEYDSDENRLISEKKIKRAAKTLVGRGLDVNKAKAAYAEGERLFKEKKYDEAAKQFFVAYDRWPDSPLEEDALFWAGEANFFADRYMAAEDAYGLLTKKYPSTSRLDKAIARRFAIARYWELKHTADPHWPVTLNATDKTRPRFDTAGHALKIYDRIRLEDPTGPYADKATMATANFYFVNRRYQDADYFYGLVRSEFPKSEFQYPAHLLGLQAKLLKYQGPDYDGKPLEEADQLCKQLLAQFPTELGKDREGIVKMQAEVLRGRATREFMLAEYYHNGKYFGASKMYYENVAREFPGTELAQQALAKIDETRGQPLVPEDKYEWLTGLFPESRKLGPKLKTVEEQNQPGVTPAPVNDGREEVARRPQPNPS